MTAKPWEETWAAVSAAETNGLNELHWGDGQHWCMQWGEDDDDLRACRLAAAAPEMARLLLGILNQDSLGYSPGEDEIRAALTKAGVLP